MIEVQETVRYRRRGMALDEAHAVRTLQAAIDAIVQAELMRFQSRLRTLTPDQHEAVQLLVRGMASSILHPAVSRVEQAAQQGDSRTVARICGLFGAAPLPPIQAREDEPGSFAWDQPESLFGIAK
jgi:glutamyl-tRNA reductase